MKAIYIYLIATMEHLATPGVSNFEEFKENPKKYYPDWDEKTMKWSEFELKNPTVDEKTGELREMNDYEKVKAGLMTLEDGSYLDEKSRMLVVVTKPNEYSEWDKESNIWIENKALKLQYLKNVRYKYQQNFLKYKHELTERENEKLEFEELGFDTSETEERIIELKSEMDLLKTEITKMTKELKKLEK